MRLTNKIRLSSIVCFGLIGILLYTCNYSKTVIEGESNADVVHASGKRYIGSESCNSCHQAVYQTHVETAHYNSSVRASPQTVKGNFGEGKNLLALGEMLQLEMIATDSALFQEAQYTNDKKSIYKHEIDLVIGSGVKGQSYLTWHNDELYQLQASYFSPLDAWINSPGASKGVLSQLRPVPANCMECHSTFAENISSGVLGNSFDKKKMILGIDCERCHGPAADHVEFHEDNPDIKTPRNIVLTSQLSRQQRLDACALCHSGIRKPIQPPFLFLTGDTLDHFSIADTTSQKLEDLDVHGNQYGLLKASQCFINSSDMSCITCHDPHKKQRGEAKFFNEKCMSCHNTQTTKFSESHTATPNFQNNCISCHMPFASSKSMLLQLHEDSVETPVRLRTHNIAVYSEELWEVKEWIENM